MLRSLLFSFCLLLFALCLGCQSRNEATTEHEHEGTSVTLWTEKTELFMEYPALIAGQEAAFAVHLSDLKDFKPVTQGRVTCVFKNAGGSEVTVIAESPSYPGIFRPLVKFSEAGVYDMELRLEGQQVADIIHVPNVRVFADEAAIPHEEETATSEELITFLKEQQWKIDFRTEPAQTHKLSGSVKAVGEILPKAQWHAEVPALVNGVILADQNANLPSVGAWVQKGAVLAVISPPANTEAGLNNVRNEYLLAKAEFERAQRLFEKQAISQKRLDEAKLRFEAKRAGYEVIAQQVDFGNAAGDGGDTPHFHLKAPIAGIIEEIHFHLGETVETGKKLFTISNPKRVWLKANIPLALLARVKAATGASFKVEGYEQEFRVDQLNGKLISVGSIVDEKSRTVPALFELENPDNQLKVGMFAEVSVQTGDAVETLAIPASAIFDDSGTPVAYVHVEGEAFAKRVLQTGISDRGFTQILSGINEGERVVTIGGYQVRLASLSTSVPVGHGHEH
ncbi:efflux RND transporter periplasmic adaptor subunit [candidate division KSB1 bacterium]|nr:efflux RND transporter periplasmic adaptor subunit [candidate division KSB1 bacterium]